jgi:electron transfer flavoprotein-quinone oxidoreductase
MEREVQMPGERKFDAIVVGAGPAGATAALSMAQKGLRVLLLERGESPGSKNMFGGMLVSCPTPEQLLPGFWDEVPWERHVVKRVMSIIGEASSTSIVHQSDLADLKPYPGYTLYRPVFDRWYAERARDAGATLLCGCMVEGLVMKNGQVCGVRVARPDGVIEAPLVIACDGTLSLLAKEAGLHTGFKAEELALGIRGLYSLTENEINERLGLSGREGATYEFLGCTEGIRGGGFIYTQIDTLSVGVVVHLDSLMQKKIPPYDLLARFVVSPAVAPLLKGARLVEYSAHLLPEGGIAMVPPRLSMGGLMVAGDAAALCYTNGLTFEGMNLAMASGDLAAEVAVEALGTGDVSARGLAGYQERLRESYVLKDLKTWGKACNFLHGDRMFSVYPKIVGDLMESIYRSDAQPKRKIGRLGRDVLKGKLPLRQLIADGIAAGRSYI